MLQPRCHLSLESCALLGPHSRTWGTFWKSKHCSTRDNSWSARPVRTPAPTVNHIYCTQNECRVLPGARNHPPRCGRASTCQSQHSGVPDSWRCFLTRWPQSQPFSLLPVGSEQCVAQGSRDLSSESRGDPSVLPDLQSVHHPESTQTAVPGRPCRQRPSDNEKGSQGWTRSPESRRWSQGVTTGD